MASYGGSGDAAAAAGQGVVGAPGGLDRKIAEGVWKILKSIMAIRQMNVLYLGAGIALGYQIPVVVNYLWSKMPSLEWHSGSGTHKHMKSRKTMIEDIQAKVDKISNLMHDENSSQFGILVVKAVTFDVVLMNGMMRQMVKWTEAPVSPVIITPDGQKEEQVICNVLDLLPQTFHAQHLNFTGKVMETGQLPRTLEHPLRAVEMVCKDGSRMQVNLKISVMNQRKDGKVGGDSYFYCIVSPLEEVEQQHSWEQVATEMYGGNAAQHVAMGRLPPPEQYEMATVLVFDVVGYTKRCARMTATEVARWMTDLHMTVQKVIAKYAVRKIETRGDCYAIVCGTRFSERDQPFDQVIRIVQCTTEIASALLLLDRTEIRVGLAYGPVTVTYIGTHVLAPTLCAFGKAMNEAAALETGGRPGFIHLTQACSERLCEEVRSFPDKIELAPPDHPPFEESVPSYLMNIASHEFVDVKTLPPKPTK